MSQAVRLSRIGYGDSGERGGRRASSRSGRGLPLLMDANKRRNVRVIMPYADALDRLAGWFVQLWAESLGKDGKDSTPTAP